MLKPVMMFGLVVWYDKYNLWSRERWLGGLTGDVGQSEKDKDGDNGQVVYTDCRLNGFVEW